MLQDLLHLIYPATCISCKETLLSEEKFVCTTCKLDLPQTNDHLSPENDLFQKFSFEPKIKFAAAFYYFVQGGIIQKMLHELKYNGKYEIGQSIGNWYGEKLVEVITPDFIVPVPIHKLKKRKRGYNQSFHFAEGLNVHFKKEVKEALIERTKQTSTQTRKSKVERWQNVENVYTDIKEDLSGCKVLVVDDVITTGATIGMLCDRLKQANVSEIYLACIARGQ